MQIRVLLLATALSCVVCGCDADPEQVYFIENLKLERLSEPDSAAAVFLSTFDYVNKSQHERNRGVSNVSAKAGSMFVDFVHDQGGTVVGDCEMADFERNPIFDVGPGESHEVRMRLQLLPSEELSVVVSCRDDYPTTGIENGIRITRTWEHTGTISADYAGEMEIAVEAAMGDPDVSDPGPWADRASSTVSVTSAP